MTLAVELHRLPFSHYIPRQEVMCWKCPPASDEGVWDILGSYHSVPMIITVHEREIIDKASELSGKLEIDESRVRLILRELTRLHEHAHAYLHTAYVKLDSIVVDESVILCGSSFLDWFDSLPKDVNEPLTEAIAFAVVKGLEQADAIRVFEVADQQAPQYYRRWMDVRNIILREAITQKAWIPPLVKFARTRVWKNWQEFIDELTKKENLDRIRNGAKAVEVALIL